MSTKKIQILGSLGSKIYTQNEEPADAPDGALWLDLDEESQATEDKDCVSIQSIEQTVISDQDGGNNVLTVTLTDGQQTAFTVKNGSKGSGSDIQPDWNQNDENADDYIKNRPFYYSDMYVEDLVFPIPTKLYATLTTVSDTDVGYALLGYKTNFTIGQSYILEIQVTQGETVVSDTIELTAYSLTSLGFPSIFSEAVALIDSKNTPYIVSGATATDLQNFSDIALVDDTMYFVYKSHMADVTTTSICKGYNNIAQEYKQIDINYIPINEILFNGSISTNCLADGSVTEEKIGEKVLSGNVLKDNSVAAEKLIDGSITTQKLEINDSAQYVLGEDVDVVKITDLAPFRRFLIKGYIMVNDMTSLTISTNRGVATIQLATINAVGNISINILVDCLTSDFGILRIFESVGSGVFSTLSETYIVPLDNIILRPYDSNNNPVLFLSGSNFQRIGIRK